MLEWSDVKEHVCICIQCNHEFVSPAQESDGLLFSQHPCPKCGSNELSKMIYQRLLKEYHNVRREDLPDYVGK